ncbi:nitroreductase family protein [Clostridium sp. DJ247]|uniref:nitroreductase family protein n=1 Tax=Clostridium sp. DJ247 TaxID=2726188 RepID=UPI001A9B8D46|nr:nitroreductase family protein [Clostridium sp. DJ247]
MNDTINILKSHRSIRKFKNHHIEDEKIRLIIESAQCASTSSFIQAYTIIRVNDREKRKAMQHLLLKMH